MKILLTRETSFVSKIHHQQNLKCKVTWSFLSNNSIILMGLLYLPSDIGIPPEIFTTPVLSCWKAFIVVATIPLAISATFADDIFLGKMALGIISTILGEWGLPSNVAGWARYVYGIPASTVSLSATPFTCEYPRPRQFWWRNSTWPFHPIQQPSWWKSVMQ